MNNKKRQQPPEQKEARSHKEMVVQVLNNRLDKLIVDYDLFFRKELRIPPEKEREQLEKSIRQLLSQEDRSGKIKLLLENLSNRFYLYSNMWQRRVQANEMGRSIRPDERVTPVPESSPQRQEQAPASALNLPISLTDQESLDRFYDSYKSFLGEHNLQTGSKGVVIDNLRKKLQSVQIDQAELQLSIEKNGLKIKIKRLNT